MANIRFLGVFTLNCLQTGHWVRVDNYVVMDWAHVLSRVQRQTDSCGLSCEDGAVFWQSFGQLAAGSLTRSQYTLAGPVYTGMPLVYPVYTGIPLGHPANTCRVDWNTTGKLCWNSLTLECHWRNLIESAPHWGTLTIAVYTGTPLEGLWQPTQAPTHIVKHAE